MVRAGGLPAAVWGSAGETVLPFRVHSYPRGGCDLSRCAGQPRGIGGGRPLRCIQLCGVQVRIPQPVALRPATYQQCVAPDQLYILERTPILRRIALIVLFLVAFPFAAMAASVAVVVGA